MSRSSLNRRQLIDALKQLPRRRQSKVKPRRKEGSQESGVGSQNSRSFPWSQCRSLIGLNYWSKRSRYSPKQVEAFTVT